MENKPFIFISFYMKYCEHLTYSINKTPKEMHVAYSYPLSLIHYTFPDPLLLEYVGFIIVLLSDG